MTQDQNALRFSFPHKNKLLSLFLIMGGIGAIALAMLAEQLGIGSPGVGFRQAILVVVGLAFLLTGVAQFFNFSQILKLSYSLLTVSSFLYISAYIIIALLRITYPFELEWLEGGSLDHVRRIFEGEKIYVTPSLDFVPYAYAPLFFYLSAGLAKITGLDFFPLRLISFLSSVGAIVTIFFLIRRETGDKFSGLLASGLFAATFEIGGSFFDIGRVDSLFVFLLLVGMYLSRFADSRKMAGAAGIVFALSFLAKQMALVFALPVILYFVLMKRRQAPYFVGAIVLVIGVTTLVMDAFHDGWYSFYVFSFHAARTIGKNSLIYYLRSDLIMLDTASCIAIFYLFSKFFWRKDITAGVFYLLLASGIIVACGISRSLSLGAGPNVIIPAYMIIAVLFGLGSHEILKFIQSAITGDAKWKYLKLFYIFICIFQFLRLSYDPFRRVPTTQDRQAGENIIRRLKQIDGEVYLPNHGYLAALAGKNTYVHTIAIKDALSNEKTQPYIRSALLEGIRERKFAAIILDHDNEWGWNLTQFKKEIDEYYALQGHIFTDKKLHHLDPNKVFLPVTGLRTRPESVYVPKN